MEKKMYCYNCNKDVNTKSIDETREYVVHNTKIKVNEKVNYCAICNNELIDETLDNDLSNIYNSYLKLYNLSLEKFLKIRESLNLTQDEFAKALNWSKRSIIRYENCQSLPQPEYLSVYKKISNNKMEFIKILQSNKMFISEKDYYSILNKVKVELSLKDINAFLYLLKDNYLNVTQIMKNFFAIDFFADKCIGKPITSFKYANAPRGPIIDKQDAFLNLLLHQGYIEGISFEQRTVYKPCMTCDLKLFTKEEIEILEKIKEKLKGKTAAELTDWSHKFKGWIETKNGEMIDFKYSKYFKLDI